MERWEGMPDLAFTCPLLQQEESPLAKCSRPSPQQPGFLGAYHHNGGENTRGRGKWGWGLGSHPRLKVKGYPSEDEYSGRPITSPLWSKADLSANPCSTHSNPQSPHCEMGLTPCRRVGEIHQVKSKQHITRVRNI